MKALAWIVGSAVAIFVLMVIVGSNVSPGQARAYNAQKNAEEMCDKMMSDAALGAERRTTREMCDKLKAEMEKRVREAK